MSEVLPVTQPTQELAADTAVFSDYLRHLGLPTDNVLASTEERRIVHENLPQFLRALPAVDKQEARYLSKLVAATAIGLFDSALNYIWNEVVLNLRRKAIVYGLDLFYDAAVGGRNRESFKDESDLDGLKDTVLLNTCRKLELISDIVYRKLDHILVMRNEVAASHPNVSSIGGFELMGWLQTCVKDVLRDRPSDSAIRIKALVDNLKSRTDVIDGQTAARFAEEVQNLALAHANNLTLSLFGMFVGRESPQILRANIAVVAPSVWQSSDEGIRYHIGTRIDGYRTNLEQAKLEKGIEFLSTVGGKMYETLPARQVALDHLADRLDDVHDGWDNFYNEPPVVTEILQYCAKSADIPRAVVPKLTKVVIRCRIGRGISYRGGVSPAGLPLYDRFLSMIDDYGITSCVIALFSPEVNARLTNTICQQHLDAVLTRMIETSISDRLKQILAFLQNDLAAAHRAHTRAEFRELCAPLITWK
jgi:hypothetical protein